MCCKRYDSKVYWLLSYAFWQCVGLQSETVFVYLHSLHTFWQDWISGIRGARINLYKEGGAQASSKSYIVATTIQLTGGHSVEFEFPAILFLN